MARYNKLAALMGEHLELAIFRRFQRLNAKSLLYMQAEILHRESELDMIELDDVRSEDKSRSLLHTSVFNLKELSGGPHDVQWKNVLEIREKLEHYSKFGKVFVSTDAEQNQRQSSPPLLPCPGTSQPLHSRSPHAPRVA